MSQLRPNPTIIGFGYQRGVGKSACIRRLRAVLPDAGITPYVFSFADPVKQLCESLFGFSPHLRQEAYRADPLYPFSAYQAHRRAGRALEQAFGEDVLTFRLGRLYDQLLVRTHHGPGLQDSVILVEDVCTPAQMRTVRHYNGFCIRIERPHAEAEAEAEAEATPALAARTQWDAVIRNESDLGRLQDEAVHVIATCLRGRGLPNLLLTQKQHGLGMTLHSAR